MKLGIRIALYTTLILALIATTIAAYGAYVFRDRIDSSSEQLAESDSLSAVLGTASGWSADALTTAKKHAKDTGFSSVVVLHQGKAVAEWGDTELVSSVHSVRKSILNLLIGKAVQEKLLDLDASLGELGIDEVTPLTPQEKQATVRDLLMAKSGVYLPALGETESTTSSKPERGAHAPGEQWVYNNWDFNVLGVILEQETGYKIGDALQQWLAVPLGMKDFQPEHVRYRSSDETLHPQYMIDMSARDLALIGQLVLNQGTWNGEQLIPAEFIQESTAPHSLNVEDAPIDVHYGYSWWLVEDQIVATGYGRQSIVIHPEQQTVIVTKVYSGNNWFEKAYFGMFKSKIEYEPYDMLLKQVAEAYRGAPRSSS